MGAPHADLSRAEEARWPDLGRLFDPRPEDSTAGPSATIPAIPDCIPDKVNGFQYLHEAYVATNPTYTGKVTVPTLWDKKTKTIVNNELSEIIRMLNTEFNAITGDKTDYYPQALRAEIDAVNERVYHNVNNGVYRSRLRQVAGGLRGGL